MAEVVTGAVVGAVVAQAFTELYKVAKDAVVKMVWCKKYCKALVRDLESLLPAFTEICVHLELPAHEWEQRILLDFKNELEQGRLLIDCCIQLNGWHPILRLRYGRAIVKLRQHILERLQTMPAFNTILLQQLNKCQQDLLKQQDKLQESINPLMSTVVENKALLMDWVRQTNSLSTPESRADTAHLDELHTDQFLFGMNESISQVKSLLFAKNEKIVTILGGMGGIGKTTLAIALCKDQQVQEFFQNRVHFFTVSQSPNMLGLLSTIWQKVVGGTVPVFQSEEDASRQLKGRLIGMPYKQLLVLDDIWSKSHLEHLSFEGKYCRTLITTRQASILETRNSTIFDLGLLNEEDAQSLFCYWAFGQDSIPVWADDGLVKEVISECKGLPLALKVIGGSLSSAVRVPLAWLNARDKLRAAEPLGEYHKDALQKRLQTSVDALDPRLQECFLDLGAYPEDSKPSVDTLLDIWVYVRGMDWTEAVLALVELSSRCLLDFDINVHSGHDTRTLEYGSAMSVSFSQHDVMRDLALYLGTQGHEPSQRTRLLMPQRGRNVPKSWLLADDQPLAAQIISINTGAMTEQDWPPMLAFPFAEVLLLHFGGGAYHLPPFVQSMCKLKVILIVSDDGVLQGVTGSLEGLCQLQSIEMIKVALITSPVTLPKLERMRLRVLPRSGGLLSMLESQTLPLPPLNVSAEPPESCHGLHSLELLCLTDCTQLYKLPKQLGNLTNLVFLGLRDCPRLDKLPASLCNLRRLEVLDIPNVV